LLGRDTYSAAIFATTDVAFSQPLACGEIEPN
jgi:hypothetical protein